MGGPWAWLRALVAGVVLVFLLPNSGLSVDNPFFDLHSGSPVGGGTAPPPGDSPPPPPCDSDDCDVNCSAGDPVYPASGRFYLSVTDLTVPGRIPMTIRRHYNTQYAYNGIVGYGWNLNVNQRLYRNASTNLVLRSGDGTLTEFSSAGGMTFSAPAGDYLAITENLDGTYDLRERDGTVRTFDSDGTLAKIENLEGDQLLFAYDPAGKQPVHGVSDFASVTTTVVIARDYRLLQIDEAKEGVVTGRGIEFFYNAEGRVTNITADTGSDVPPLEVHYSYDPTGRGDLASFTNVEGTDFPYSYDDLHRLTNFFLGGCACGQRQNVYDEEGRVIQQTLGNSVIDFEYLVPGQQTRVTTHVVHDDTLAPLLDKIEIFDFTPTGKTQQYRLQLGAQLDPGGGEQDDLLTIYLFDVNTDDVVQIHDPGGRVRSLSYDGLGNLASETVTNSTGEIITSVFEYDTNSRLTNEYVTSSLHPGIFYAHRAMTYDTQGRLLMETRIATNGLTLARSNLYEIVGSVDRVTSTDPEGHRWARDFDAAGNRTREFDPDNPAVETQYGFNSRGSMTNRIDALGNEWRFEYDHAGRLVREINPLGFEDLLIYGGEDLIARETGRDGGTPGRVEEFTYDSFGRRTAAHRLDDNGSTNLWNTMEYDSEGNVLVEGNALGGQASFEYDAAGRIVVEEDIYGGRVTNLYDQADNLVSLFDPIGVETRMEYDLLDRMTNRVEAVGTAVERTTALEYDPTGRLLRIRHPDGTETVNTYDGFGRLAAVGGSAAFPFQIEYDGNDLRTAHTDGNSNRTIFAYDPYGRRLSTGFADGATNRISYNPAGQAVTRTDGNSNSVYFVYDPNDRLLTRSVPNNSNAVLEARAYNPWGEIVQTSNIVGAVTLTALDRRGRTTNTVNASGLSVQWTYDELDQPILITWPGGSTHSNRYDGERLVESRQRSGLTATREYDLAGRAQSTSNSLGLVQLFEYDELNRLLSSSNSLDESTSFAYDAQDRITAITYPDGLVESFLFDGFGKVTNRSGAGQYAVTFSYDPAGNRTLQTDAENHSTTWTYDARNRVNRKTYHDASYEERTYDGNGNLATRRNPAGIVTAYAYDARNRPTLIDYPDDADVILVHDALGRRTRVETQVETNEWTYDQANRIVSNLQHRTMQIITFTYDAEDNRTSLTRNGETSMYGYDIAGRRQSITNHTGAYTYTYQPEGDLVTALTFPSGASVSNAYDPQGRLVLKENRDSVGVPVSSFSYAHDDAGTRTNVVLADMRSRAFQYDDTRQLVQADGFTPGGAPDPGHQFAYAYDGSGNHTQVTRLGVADTFSINDLNQFVTSSVPTAMTFNYDAAGNLLAAGSVAYTWDQEDRLTMISNGVNRTEFIYNGSGFVVERRDFQSEILQDVRRFVYDGSLLLAELDGSNNVVCSYLHGLDLTSTIDGAGGAGGVLSCDGGATNTSYYFYDGRGNVVDVLDPGDTLIAHYEYDPFGGILATAGSNPAGNAIRFSSKRFDDMHNIIDFGFRFFDPDLGRWLNRDPLAERESLNLYAFVQNNPMNQVDVLGLSSITIESLGVHLPTAAPPGFGEGDANGATRITKWLVKAKTRKCRKKDCRSTGKKFRVKITRCVGKGDYWWSPYKSDSEDHELRHKEIWTQNWNSMIGRMNDVAGQCGSSENAACRDTLIDLLREFYFTKGFQENLAFDCQEYDSDTAKEVVCGKAEEQAQKMQDLENQIVSKESECAGL